MSAPEITSAKPVPLAPRFESIPSALRELPAWVAWRYEWRTDKKGGGKWTKPPLKASGTGYAATNDQTTWADFEAAKRATTLADGVGLVLTADLVGVDLDHVLSEAGEVEPWASEVLERFVGCYVERSPGGDGLRIFCRGFVHRSGKGGPTNRLEVYGSGSPRYLTVTGHRMREGDVIEAQAALDWLHVRYFEVKPERAAAPAGAMSDEDVLRRARTAANGPKFSRLWFGDAGEDASSADAALVAILAFWTQDAAQIDRLFRRSGLMRPKWDEMRGTTTYGERTIAAILERPGNYFGATRIGTGATEQIVRDVISGNEQPRTEPPPVQPLPPDLLPVETFPMKALPEAFRPWVADVSDRMQCPPDFVGVPLLVAAASLVARRVGIRPQARTDWTERGNLWALIVGRPGVMKSPAMSQALAPLDRLEARAAQDFNAQAAQQQAAALAAKLKTEAAMKTARAALKKDASVDVAGMLYRDDEEDEAPPRRRYVVNDLTYEALGEILAANPDGVLSVRDEMRGLFLSLAREESAPARAFYLQAWSGGRYTFDRIMRGTVTVEDARLSMIGGIQPGPLSELVQQARRGAADDGMIERFLIAWPDVGREWREVDRWPETDARRTAWGVFDRLDTLAADALRAEQDVGYRGGAAGLPFLRFDDAAREAFGEWRTELEGKLRGAEDEGLEGALSKFRHHVPALALALHVIDGCSGPVGLPSTVRALALAEYFESHARRLHGSGRRLTVRAARTILDKARAAALPNPFTARDVYRNQWAGLSDRAAVADALDLLAGHGWLTETTVDTGGRPSTVYALTEEARHG